MFNIYNQTLYEVRLTKKAAKGIRCLPKNAQETFWTLVHAIEDTGPVQPRFPNYSKLGNFTYYCHLAYHWVACWRNENGSIVVEVYYVGSREDAPY